MQLKGIFSREKKRGFNQLNLIMWILVSNNKSSQKITQDHPKGTVGRTIASVWVKHAILNNQKLQIASENK